jgi:hypothetical protein
MEAAIFSETSVHLTTAQCRNPEEGHDPINNRCENLKIYKNIHTDLFKYFAIELKK